MISSKDTSGHHFLSETLFSKVKGLKNQLFFKKGSIPIWTQGHISEYLESVDEIPKYLV